MKHFVIILFCWMFSIIDISAQAKSTHIIQRGETLESVAKKYNVTVEELRALNPGIEDAFYVGMKLSLPITENSTQGQVKSVKQTAVPSPASINNSNNAGQQFKLPYEDNKQTINVSDNLFSKLHIGVFAGLSLNDWYGKDAKGTNYILGYHLGLSANYFFSEEFFIELNAGYVTKGYKQDTSDSSGSVWDEDGANYDSEGTVKLSTNNIEVALLFGSGVSFTNDVFVGVKLGPYITNALSGKKKREGSITTYEDIHSSETERYKTESKLKDWKEYEKFGYGLQASLGTYINKVSLFVTYQMGLSKMEKKKDAHEHAVLFTLGYFF